MDENLNVVSENSIKPMNFIQRITGVIFSPGRLMQDLAQKPRILFGLLLTLIAPAVMILAIMPMYREYSRVTLEATYANMNIQMSPEQLEQAVDFAAIIGPISGAAGAAAMLFLGALILWGIVKIFKGEGRYKQFLSITGYTSVISALSVITAIISTRLTGAFNEVSYTSLAALLPDMKGSFIYGAAKALDVFSIWQYIVIAIGTAAVSKLDKKKAYLIVGCIFAVLLVYYGVMEVRAAGLINQ